MQRPHSGAQAFTITELFVGISVIAILSALLLPSLKKAHGHAKSVVCLSQLRNLGIHSFVYADDHNGQLPIHPRSDRSISPFPKDLELRKLFICPADTERSPAPPLAELNRTNTSYFASYSARLDQPRSIIAGDRNVTAYSPITRGQIRQTGAMTFHRTNSFGWWRDIHQAKGNLLLADASAQTTGSRQFTALAAEQPTPAFAWHIPNGDTLVTPAPSD